jgi:hypothetical protein
MSKKSVFCIATSRNRAEQMIANLRTANFSSKDLSVVFPNRIFLGEPGAQNDTQIAPRNVADATQGGVEDLASAWTGPGTLVLACFGRFTAVGPLLAALRQANQGAPGGNLAESLIRLGVPVFEAKQYESRMKNGNILIAVFLDDLKAVAQAEGILSETYGENLCTIDLVLAEQVVSAGHSLPQCSSPIRVSFPQSP